MTTAERRPTGELDDLARGQSVVVAARWLLALAGLVVALWNPGPIGELRLQIGAILFVAVANFYLHAQLLRRQPAVDAVAYAASAADLAVIGLLVISQGGFNSELYVFYFPAVLAISVAFCTRVSAVFALAAAGSYAVIALPGAIVAGSPDLLLLRLIGMLAVAYCGNVYWRREVGSRWQPANRPFSRPAGPEPNAPVPAF